MRQTIVAFAFLFFSSLICAEPRLVFESEIKEEQRLLLQKTLDESLLILKKTNDLKIPEIIRISLAEAGRDGGAGDAGIQLNLQLSNSSLQTTFLHELGHLVFNSYLILPDGRSWNDLYQKIYELDRQIRPLQKRMLEMAKRVDELNQNPTQNMEEFKKVLAEYGDLLKNLNSLQRDFIRESQLSVDSGRIFLRFYSELFADLFAVDLTKDPRCISKIMEETIVGEDERKIASRQRDFTAEPMNYWEDPHEYTFLNPMRAWLWTNELSRAESIDQRLRILKAYLQSADSEWRESLKDPNFRPSYANASERLQKKFENFIRP